MPEYEINEYTNGELETRLTIIEADNINDAINQAFEIYLTPEQREKVTVLENNEFRMMYHVETNYINGNELSSEIGIVQV